MATKLFLRSTTANGITDTGDGVVQDMITTAGSAATTGVVNTITGDNVQVQWTKTAGGLSMAWISGRVPAGGFTLTTCDLDAWCQENNMSANCSVRARVYRYQPGTPTITELGGPFDDDVEFGTSAASMTWAANVTDTAFAENDRILLRLFIEDAPAVNMATGFTCTLTYNAANAATGDSFFNIAETVAFKAEPIVGTPLSSPIFGEAP